MSEPLARVPGLSYYPEFISPELHDTLLREVDAQPWRGDLKRRVQHYGYRYDYKARSVDISMRLGDLPEWARQVAEMFRERGLVGEMPDQLIVNEYEPGQGISPHVDCEPCFGEPVISLTLGSGCVMNFTCKESGEVVPIYLEPRSLVVLAGAARYDWMHSIPSRRSDPWQGRTIPRERRVSLTFRKVILS